MENNDLKKLKDMVKDIRVAMLTTLDNENELRSRPMATTEISNEEAIYFFTYENSAKTQELNKNGKVNISYMDKDDQVFVSISGNASIVKDKNKIASLWSPHMKAWFPKGKEDPNISLLKVKINKAEYWDIPVNKMTKLIGMTKAAVTGKPYEPGENKKINL